MAYWPPSCRPALCEYGDVCTKAHSEAELQEWVQRARNTELWEQAAWREGLVPYQARLLAEYQRSGSEVLVVSGGCVSGPGRGRGPGCPANGQASPCSWLRLSMACLCPVASPFCTRPRRRELSTAGRSPSIPR